MLPAKISGGHRALEGSIEIAGECGTGLPHDPLFREAFQMIG